MKTPFLFSTANTAGKVKVAKGIIKKSWGEESDAQINLVPRWRFFNQWNDVTGSDTLQSTIQIGPREQHGEIDKGSWFWIEGVKEELDSPGEWYLDHNEGNLYYKTINNESPNNSEIVFPYLNRLFYLKGNVEKNSYVQNIHFQGFEFQHTTFTLGQIEARVHTDGAIVFENASDCSITESKFQNIGGYALWMHLDSRNNVFDKNTVINSGGGGVLMTGSRLSYMDDTKVFTPGEKAAKVFPIHNRITRNTVEHCGKIRYYGGGVHIDSRPASMAMEQGNYIAHNHFRDLSRNGIFLFRNQGGNVIEFNEIHDCMQTTIDGAAIHFATMNRLAAPNFILNNYLYDIWGYEQLPTNPPRRTLANGIFLDWATSNTKVANNVIYNAGEREIKPIMGNWNLVMDNNLVSKTKIEPLLKNEIGPKGNASHSILSEQLKNSGKVVTSSENTFITYIGKWESKRIAGMRNLFNYDCKQAPPDVASSCEYVIPVTESGTYKVCIMYFPDEKNASNATISIEHPRGTEQLTWNFRTGDNLGFSIVLGEYALVKGSPVKIKISNENADGYIIADGIGIIKQK
ncbi:MAG: right-handed parallel beta-helix repeat-containing protein [Chitinophagaceae bacterium]